MTDPHDMQEEIITKVMEEEFCKSLTDKQLDVYLNCLKLQVKKSEYAKAHDVSAASVCSVEKLLRKKYKKFFQ